MIVDNRIDGHILGDGVICYEADETALVPKLDIGSDKSGCPIVFPAHFAVPALSYARLGDIADSIKQLEAAGFEVVGIDRSRHQPRFSVCKKTYGTDDGGVTNLGLSLQDNYIVEEI